MAYQPVHGYSIPKSQGIAFIVTFSAVVSKEHLFCLSNTNNFKPLTHREDAYVSYYSGLERTWEYWQ